VGRENELSVLLQAWHDALGGQPQVVAFVVQARLGKTRVLQEFYHWLNQFEDPGNYWPDTLPGGDASLHVNPIVEGYLPPCSISSSFRWTARLKVSTSSTWSAAWRRKVLRPYIFFALWTRPT
jgi:hypothetical protein